MIPDNTVRIAVRQGIKTSRTIRAASSLRKTSQFAYTPEEMAAVLERERTKRIDADIAAYAIRKRSSE